MKEQSEESQREVFPSQADQLKGITVLGKIELPLGYLSRRERRPRPVAKNPKAENSQHREGVAQSMTDEFERGLNRGSWYNDNLDIDQQSEEYWSNL